jgi:hypothetical protein
MGTTREEPVALLCHERFHERRKQHSRLARVLQPQRRRKDRAAYRAGAHKLSDRVGRCGDEVGLRALARDVVLWLPCASGTPRHMRACVRAHARTHAHSVEQRRRIVHGPLSAVRTRSRKANALNASPSQQERLARRQCC